MGNPINSIQEDEDATYKLKLFVNGASSISLRAIHNLKTILHEHLENRYILEIIDVHQQPLLVNSEDIVAIPLLIKQSPLPSRRLIGDMSNKVKVLKGLGLISKI